MNYEKIGEFIAEKRKKKNLTQAELAKKLGVTDKAVSKWERGLGCPDISILEILAKELDVSVLELLKGRKIENEVIKVTEADDYVKDTFKVSKHLFNKESKKRVSIILMSISILIVIIMCIFNINTYRRLAKKEVVELSFIYEEDYLEEPYTSFNERKELLKKYANLVEHNKGSLTDEEQGYLLTFLNNLYEYYDKAFMFNIADGTKLSFNDIYVNLEHDFTDFEYPQTLPVMRTYIKYVSDKYPEDLREAIYDMRESEQYFLNLYDNKFRSQLQFEIEETGFDSVEYIYHNIIQGQMRVLKPYLEMVEGIMKEAGIHE